jgi:hypothetical protein
VLTLKYSTIMQNILILLLSGLLAACGGQPSLRGQATRPANPAVDFSGSWEMDFGRSDNINERLQIMYREWQRAAEKRSNMNSGGRGQGPTVSVNASRGFNGMIAAARLAELITESQVLEIEQGDLDIEIKRENSFALTCVFSEGEPEVVLDKLGAEICGWDASDLVFRIQLPDGLNIFHRVTMSEAGDRLRVATTVDSDAGAPFTVNRFYYRFNPLPEDYSCEYTLSKGNVCQRNKS